MPVYLVAQGRITDREKLDAYMSSVGDTITPDMKILAVDETPEVVEGSADPPRTVVIEFASRDAFRAWYDSDAYQGVIQLRLDSVEGNLVVAEGFVPPE